jgi:uncharacterized membrane protein YphA (DoxX/SURF4 family)
MPTEDINQQKNVEFFAASVNAWYNTSLEHDKGLFTLSAGGIGLLVTLLTTIGVSSALLLGLYITAIACFLASLLAVLIIFSRNKAHIEETILPGAQFHDNFLRTLDLVALYAFGIGAVFSATIGISVAVSSFNSKEKIVANDSKGSTSTRALAQDSFHGVANLQKSFNGVGKLQSQPTAGAPASVPAPVASTSTTTSPASPQQGTQK